MDTSNTASPPTSELSGPAEPEPHKLQFRDLAGVPLDQPREWAPAIVEMQISPEGWNQARLTLQGAQLPIYVRQFAGGVRVLADWPRSGAGHYELELELPEEREFLRVTIAPEKISSAAFAQLLEDLTLQLPAEVAIGLQRLGALSGIQLLPPAETTMAGELVRLRRAITGHAGRPGLIAVLDDLARDHLEVLQTFEHWVPSERARRPSVTGITRVMARRNNLDSSGRPLRVLDIGMQHTADVYENRLVNVFTHQVLLRLRALERVAAASGNIGVAGVTRELLHILMRARQCARFLNAVSLPEYLPNHLTMALTKRPAYRAALEGYLEFYRSAMVRMDTPALEAPLENLPYLYQLWGTLQVICALLQVAAEHGYQIDQQRLVGRDGTGFYVRVLPDGGPAVVLRDPVTNTTAKLIPERTYGRSGTLHSISYPQRPDVALEVTDAGGRTRICLFDPKYKLASETVVEADVEGELDVGKPHKVDIDKMHAYRDSIRDVGGRCAVNYAAILYPGPAMQYWEGIEALHAYPGDNDDLDRRLKMVVSRATDVFARNEGLED
jgi:hypothetical protein